MAGGFDFFDSAGGLDGEIFVSVGCDEEVIFDADADALEGFSAFDIVVGVEVETGFDGEDHTGCEDAGVALEVAIAASVVDVEAEPVGGAVHIKGLVSAFFDEGIEAALEDLEVDESLGDLSHSGIVDIGEGFASETSVDAGIKGIEDDLIDIALLAGKATVGGEGSGDIGGVVIPFAARVDEDEIAILEGVFVFGVMEDGGIFARADDGLVGSACGAAAFVVVMKQGGKLVLVHTGLCGGHCGLVGGAIDGGGFSHPRDLGFVFEESHLGGEDAGIDDLGGGDLSKASLSLHSLEPSEISAVLVGFQACADIDAFDADEEAGEFGFHCGDGMGDIDAVVA